MSGLSKVDAVVSGGGSVYLVTPLTPVAKRWIRENVQSDAQYLGNGLAVEWRYIEDLVNGMREAGLAVKG